MAKVDEITKRFWNKLIVAYVKYYPKLKHKVAIIYARWTFWANARSSLFSNVYALSPHYCLFELSVTLSRYAHPYFLLYAPLLWLCLKSSSIGLISSSYHT